MPNIIPTVFARRNMPIRERTIWTVPMPYFPIIIVHSPGRIKFAISPAIPDLEERLLFTPVFFISHLRFIFPAR